MQEFVEKLIERLEEESRDSQENMVKSTSNLVANFCSGASGAYNKTIAIVNQLAEEYNNGWISVEERLPEETECYLVTWRDRVTCKNYVEIVEYDAGSQEWLDCICQAGLLGYDIIAWQPLPTPFVQK